MTFWSCSNLFIFKKKTNRNFAKRISKFEYFDYLQLLAIDALSHHLFRISKLKKSFFDDEEDKILEQKRQNEGLIKSKGFEGDKKDIIST